MLYLLPTLPVLPVLLIHIFAALLPAAYLLRYIYRHDTVEKEPWPLLASLLGVGVLAAVCSGFLEGAGEWMLQQVVSEYSLYYTTLLAFLVVAVIEEGTKFLFLLWRTWRHPAFNYRFDGVVYAVFVSLGFAAFENVTYVIGYGLSVAIPRALLAVPGHMAFSVFMGLFYGRAKQYQSRSRFASARLHLWAGYLVAVFLHGFYDACALSGTVRSTVIFLVFVLIMFLAAFSSVRRASERDVPVGQPGREDAYWLVNGYARTDGYGHGERRNDREADSPESAAPDGRDSGGKTASHGEKDPSGPEPPGRSGAGTEPPGRSGAGTEKPGRSGGGTEKPGRSGAGTEPPGRGSGAGQEKTAQNAESGTETHESETGNTVSGQPAPGGQQDSGKLRPTLSEEPDGVKWSAETGWTVERRWTGEGIWPDESLWPDYGAEEQSGVSGGTEDAGQRKDKETAEETEADGGNIHGTAGFRTGGEGGIPELLATFFPGGGQEPASRGQGLYRSPWSDLLLGNYL